MDIECDPVNHPRHYTKHPSGLECIEVTRLLSFDLGNAVKYVWRTNLKNGLQDLQKADWYLNDHIKYFGGATEIDKQAKKLLLTVANAEGEGSRSDFFRSIAYGFLYQAREYVDDMIEQVGE